MEPKQEYQNFGPNYNKDMVRTHYFYELYRTIPRVLTIVYTYDHIAGVVNYGACMFKQTDPRISFQRKPHRETAMSRFERWPVTFNVGDLPTTNDELMLVIRKTVTKRGVRGERANNTSDEEVNEDDSTN